MNAILGMMRSTPLAVLLVSAQADMTVLSADGRIPVVAPPKSIRVRASHRVVEGAGRDLISGLCRDAFADSLATREIAALGRVAAVEPVWDNYRLARHPLLLLADSTHHGAAGTPVCAAIWRAGKPLRIIELAERPPFSTPLYGMINLDAAGAAPVGSAIEFAAAWKPAPASVAAALRAEGVTRAVVLNVPLDFHQLGVLGAVLTRMHADPARMHADLATHESFHLQVQIPAWLDQHQSYEWPGWDIQPDRAELRQRCYAGTPAISAALESELAALLAAFNDVAADSTRHDPVAGLSHARQFVEARAVRRRLQDTMTVARAGGRISCALAEDLMELEEGTAQWIGQATSLRAGLTTMTTLLGSYSGTQPEAFYKTGPLQLWVLDGLLGQDGMRRLTRSIARSRGPDGAKGGLFAQFAERTSVLAETVRPDSVAIAGVIADYLHGLKFNDTLSLQKAFWPAAKLFWVKRDGTLGELTQSQWYAGFRGHAGEEEVGTLRATAILQTRDAASATIVEDYPGSRYTDYVSLLRIGGRWWIVNKIYTVEPRP
jgi:hypothetical protein